MKSRSASWVLYDIASSAYILMITGVAFPLYFKIHVTQNAQWSDALWGALLALSSILAGIVAPLVGAAADISGERLRYLTWSTVICSAATVLLSIPDFGLAAMASLFCLSYVAYLVAAGLYDALLKGIAQGRSAGWLSSLGWGLGYLGGLLCYFLCSALLGSNVGADNSATFALTFLVVGSYYAVVGGVALFGMRQVQTLPQGADGGRLLFASAMRTMKTVRRWKTGGLVPRAIVGGYMIAGAATTLALFTPILLASHFGLEVKQVAWLSAVFSVISIPATLLAGWLALRVGSLTIIYGVTPLWLVLVVLLIFGSGWWAGLAVALCFGVAIGPTNSMARALVTSIVEESDAALMFGFAAMVQRLISAIAPFFFGVLSSATGERWPAVLMSGSILVVGLLVTPNHFRHRQEAIAGP